MMRLLTTKKSGYLQDLSKCYDRVDTRILRHAMHRLKIPGNFIDLTIDLFTNRNLQTLAKRAIIPSLSESTRGNLSHHYCGVYPTIPCSQEFIIKTIPLPIRRFLSSKAKPPMPPPPPVTA